MNNSEIIEFLFGIAAIMGVVGMLFVFKSCNTEQNYESCIAGNSVDVCREILK